MKRRHQIDLLEARLLRAWRSSEGPELGPRWKAGVMNAVRAEVARAHAEVGPPAERLVRNALMAAVAAAAVAVAVIGPRAAALDPSLELARILASDPQTLLQLVMVL